MIKTRKNITRPFYVVQFVELPYEGIDDYICVPNTWVILLRENQKAVVVYPSEDPLVTKDRVKRQESISDKWTYYTAFVRYESDTFNDAYLWINTRNNYGPIVEEDSGAKDTEPMFPADKKLLSSNRSLNSSKSKKDKSLWKVDNPRKPLPKKSSKRPAISELFIQFHEKRAKLDEASQSIMTAVYYGYEGPGCSKNYQPIKIKDNQPTTNAQTEETASASNDKRSTVLKKPDISLPPNVDKSAGDATIDAEDCGQGVNQSYQSKNLTLSHLFSSTTAATMTAPKLLSTTEQKSQPQIADDQSVATVCDKHEQRINDIIENGASSSCHLLESLKMSANLYSQMDGTRRLVSIKPTVTRQIRPMNIDRKLTVAAENPSILMYQNGSLSTCSVEEQSLVLSQNHSQDISHEHPSLVQRLYRNLLSQEQYLQQTTRLQDIAQRPIEFQTNDQNTSSLAERSFTESNNHDHRINIQSSRMRSPQKKPQRPKIRVGITFTPKSNSEHSMLKGATKRTSPLIVSKVLNSIHKKLMTIHKNHLLNEEESQGDRKVKTNKHNSKSLATSPENIAASAKRKIYNEIPTCSFHQSPRTQHTENEHQNFRIQKQLVDQSTDSNLRMEQEIESPPKVMDNTCQTDECNIENSLYHGVTFNPDAVTENEKISNHDKRTKEIPAETINDYSTGIDTGNNFEDGPTSAQNSPSASHQTDSRLVLEQQKLDNFATLVTRMGSTLWYSCDMLNKLRRSIIDATKTYKNLLAAFERFNTASNVSTSSNVAPEVQQPAEERPVQVKLTKKNLGWFILPPNYDCHNSRWTLKYRKITPGLEELMPQSGIYVGCGELMYCKQVSKDCQSLARLLLQEVFNRDALSVCLSMTEKAQVSNNVGYNVRPRLDENANTTLLNFVIEHGLRYGWNIDLQRILTSLHELIQEIRSKYGLNEKC